MIRPISRGIKERVPSRQQWECTSHGPLEPGEVECDRCTEDGER